MGLSGRGVGHQIEIGPEALSHALAIAESLVEITEIPVVFDQIVDSWLQSLKRVGHYRQLEIGILSRHSRRGHESDHDNGHSDYDICNFFIVAYCLQLQN